MANPNHTGAGRLTAERLEEIRTFLKDFDDDDYPLSKPAVVELLSHIDALSPPAEGGRDFPSDWLPTAANVNALPEPLRKYISALETDADPAGTIRSEFILRNDIVPALTARVAELEAIRDKLLTDLNWWGDKAQEAERRLAAARAEALEEAARLIDGWSNATNYLPVSPTVNQLAGWLNERDTRMGVAIRALSTPVTSEEGT